MEHHFLGNISPLCVVCQRGFGGAQAGVGVVDMFCRDGLLPGSIAELTFGCHNPCRICTCEFIFGGTCLNLKRTMHGWATGLEAERRHPGNKMIRP